MSKTDSKRKNLTKRIVIGVVIALVFLFIVFLFITTNFLGSSMIVTETAYQTTAYDVVKTNAMIVRDEEYIKASHDGIVVYEASDGAKVQANGTIATVYHNESDVAAMNRISELEEKITYLESVNTVARSVNIGLDTVKSQLNDKVVNFLGLINSRTFEYIEDVEDDLLSSVLRQQIITGKQGKLDDKISQLKTELEQLKSTTGSPAGTVTTTASGYFVSQVDGYENSVDVNALDTFYYSDFKNVKPEKVKADDYTGKIIKGVNWYLVCPVSSDESVNISHNSANVSVRIPYAVAGEIPAKVLYVNNLSDQDKAIVVLQCNYMNETLSKIRKESVEIVVNSYVGLKVSKSALHDDTVKRTVTGEDGKKKTETNKVQGVYVEYGNELRFRQVVILYSGDDYVICAEDPDDKLLFNGDTITLYDKIVIEGDDLYDGKLIH